MNLAITLQSRAPRVVLRLLFVVALSLIQSLVLLGADLARAQTQTEVQTPPAFRSWKIGSGSGLGGEIVVAQATLPVQAQMRIGDSADLVASFAAGGSIANPEAGPSTRLNGLTSLTTQLFVRRAHDRVLLQTGMTLPTGARALNSEELVVLQAINLPVLGFSLRHYGRGFEWSGGASVAGPLGSQAVGSLGVGGVIRASYELVEGHPDYGPASEMSLTGGVDLGEAREGGGRPLRLDVTYRMMGVHEEGNRKILDEGNQLELQGSGRTRGTGLVGELFVRGVLKAENGVYDTTGAALEKLKSESGNSLLLQLRGSLPQGTHARLGLAGEWNLVSGSSSFAQNGHAYGIGPFLDCPAGSQAHLLLEASYLWGSLNVGDGAEDVPLQGLSLIASIQWGGPR